MKTQLLLCCLHYGWFSTYAENKRSSLFWGAAWIQSHTLSRGADSCSRSVLRIRLPPSISSMRLAHVGTVVGGAWPPYPHPPTFPLGSCKLQSWLLICFIAVCTFLGESYCWALRPFPICPSSNNESSCRSLLAHVWGYLLGRFLEAELIESKGICHLCVDRYYEIDFPLEKNQNPIQESAVGHTGSCHTFWVCCWCMRRLTAVSFCIYFLESGYISSVEISFCFMFVYCLSDPLSFLFSWWIISPSLAPSSNGVHIMRTFDTLIG